MLPGAEPWWIGQERARRIGDLHQAGVVHLEHADLVGRTEPVLGRPEQPHRGVSFALEADHRIHQVLECLGSGDRAVLGDVPDEDDRDPIALGEVHQAQCRLADLPDAPRGAVELIDGRGLDRINDHERGSRSASDLGDASDVVLRQDLDPFAGHAGQDAEARRPQPDLPGRFLARRVEDAGRSCLGACEAGRRLEEEGRLADPRLAAEEHE